MVEVTKFVPHNMSACSLVSEPLEGLPTRLKARHWFPVTVFHFPHMIIRGGIHEWSFRAVRTLDISDHGREANMSLCKLAIFCKGLHACPTYQQRSVNKQVRKSTVTPCQCIGPDYIPTCLAYQLVPAAQLGLQAINRPTQLGSLYQQHWRHYSHIGLLTFQVE